jgi:hypothetical protein
MSMVGSDTALSVKLVAEEPKLRDSSFHSEINDVSFTEAGGAADVVDELIFVLFSLSLFQSKNIS